MESIICSNNLYFPLVILFNSLFFLSVNSYWFSPIYSFCFSMVFSIKSYFICICNFLYLCADIFEVVHPCKLYSHAVFFFFFLFLVWCLDLWSIFSSSLFTINCIFIVCFFLLPRIVVSFFLLLSFDLYFLCSVTSINT